MSRRRENHWGNGTMREDPGSDGVQGTNETDHINAITGAIVDAAYGIHVNLGSGLLESVYEKILARDLERRGFQVERQRRFSFEYQGLWFEDAFRVDLLIDSQVVVEIKSVAKLAENHIKQLLTYIKLLDCRVGLLLNFGEARMKDGIKRVANKMSPSAPPPSAPLREKEHPVPSNIR